MALFSSPLTTVLILLGVVALVYLISVRVKRQRELREELNNPRSKNINETNYNISREGMDDHRLPEDGMDTLQQAENLDDTEQIPSDKEFYEGREKL